MVDKPDHYGEKIGTVQWKFGRADRRAVNTDVNSQVYVSEIDLEFDTEYGVVMQPVGGNHKPFDDAVTFTTEIYSEERRFTVPVDVIRNCNIKPGHSVNLTLYELEQPEQTLVTDGHDADQSEIEMDELLEKRSDLLDLMVEMETTINQIRDILRDE